MKPVKFIMTRTGPVALLDDGKWYSVNGSADEVVDIRYEVDLSVSWRGTPAERDAVREAVEGLKSDW